MTGLEARAEVLRLGRLLGRDVPGLAVADAADLRALRAQVTDVLFDADRPLLARAAAAAGRLPVPVVAAIARRAFGPLLVARMAGALDVERAVAVAARLPTPFLAEVAQELDPRRAPAVVAGIPPARIVEVCAELAARGDVVAMGRLVGALPDATLRSCVAVLDEATLLRTAFVLEDKTRLDAVVADLRDDRIRAVFAAAGREGLWPEALDLVAHLRPARRRRVAALVAEEDNAVLAELVRTARAEGLLGEVVRLLPSVARGRLR